MKANIIELQEALRLEKMKRYQELKETISSLQKEEKALKEEIIKMMTDGKLVAGDLVAILKTTQVHGIDKDALRSDFPEIWTEYEKITERKSLVIS